MLCFLVWPPWLPSRKTTLCMECMSYDEREKRGCVGEDHARWREGPLSAMMHLPLGSSLHRPRCRRLERRGRGWERSVVITVSTAAAAPVARGSSMERLRCLPQSGATCGINRFAGQRSFFGRRRRRFRDLAASQPSLAQQTTIMSSPPVSRCGGDRDSGRSLQGGRGLHEEQLFLRKVGWVVPYRLVIDRSLTREEGWGATA